MAQGYRTYYRNTGRCLEAGVEESFKSSDTGRVSEIRLLMDSATRLLATAVHCLDASDWPFSVAEVLANRMSFVAAALHAHQGEHQFNFEWQRALRFDFPSSCSAPARLEAGASGSVCRTLDRLLIRWVRGLDSEVGFWHALMDPETQNNPDVDPAAWRSARTWLEEGHVSWHYGDICSFVETARAASGEQFGRPRVLNAGSGPLAPKDIACQDGKAIPVVAADGLARFYMQLYDILGHEPPAVPAQCPTELLHQCFPQHHFDVVHVRNSLDHANDPLLGIRQMLQVARPGGWVLLRHARNEGVAGHFQLGLHQWAFDIEDSADGPHFVIWSPSLRADVTQWLLSSNLSSEVRAELRPHPSGGPEQYVWVDIRKPLHEHQEE